MKRKALYTWNWECGGFNQTHAFTKAEALKEAEKIWPGHPVRLSSVKRITSKKGIEAYYNSIPLMD
jgi:hypothetical protein